MSPLSSIIGYIISHYPHKNEMSNARLTKTVYLADWHFLLNKGKRLTNINWYFDNYGPFVWDVKKEVESRSDLFDIHNTLNSRGSKKILIEVKDNINFSDLVDGDEKSSLDSVIGSTKNLYWDDFIRLVYSTYPVMSGSRYSNLDLEKCASEYKERKALLAQKKIERVGS